MTLNTRAAPAELTLSEDDLVEAVRAHVVRMGYAVHGGTRFVLAAKGLQAMLRVLPAPPPPEEPT